MTVFGPSTHAPTQRPLLIFCTHPPLPCECPLSGLLKNPLQQVSRKETTLTCVSCGPLEAQCCPISVPLCLTPTSVGLSQKNRRGSSATCVRPLPDLEILTVWLSCLRPDSLSVSAKRTLGTLEPSLLFSLPTRFAFGCPRREHRLLLFGNLRRF